MHPCPRSWRSDCARSAPTTTGGAKGGGHGSASLPPSRKLIPRRGTPTPWTGPGSSVLPNSYQRRDHCVRLRFPGRPPARPLQGATWLTLSLALPCRPTAMTAAAHDSAVSTAVQSTFVPSPTPVENPPPELAIRDIEFFNPNGRARKAKRYKAKKEAAAQLAKGGKGHAERPSSQPASAPATPVSFLEA